MNRNGQSVNSLSMRQCRKKEEKEKKDNVTKDEEAMCMYV